MSLLLADSLNLTLGRNSSVPLGDYDEDVYGGKALGTIGGSYEERVASAKKQKKLEMIHRHLRAVQDRVTHALTEAGYSAELPDPCLEKAIKKTLSFAFTPQKNENAKENENKRTLTKIVAGFVYSASHRYHYYYLPRRIHIKNELGYELLSSVVEWLSSASMMFSGSSTRAAETARVKQDKLAQRSKIDCDSAMERTAEAINKLKQIGASIFEEKEDTAKDKSSMAPEVQARFNNKFRRDSIRLDGVSKKERVTWMKTVIGSDQLEDLNTVVSEYDEDNEAEKILLDDVSSNWRATCIDIRDHLILVHEEKMLRRGAKLRIRRALFLFKIIIALLSLRSEQLQSLEATSVKLKADHAAVKSRLDHMHKEVKKWKEKFTSANSAITRLSSENKQLQDENDKLRADLGTCIDKVAEKDLAIQELKQTLKESEEKLTQQEAAVPITDSVDTVELTNRLQTAETRVGSLRELIQRQEVQIEELKAAANAAQNVNAEDALREENLRNQERAERETLHNMLIQNEEKISKLETLVDDQDEELNEKKKEIERLQSDLEAKEEVIRKLMEMDDDEDESMQEKVSIPSFRRNSKDLEIRRSKMLRPDNDPRGMSELIKASSTRLFPKPTRSCLNALNEEAEKIKEPNNLLSAGNTVMFQVPLTEAESGSYTAETLIVPSIDPVKSVKNEEYLRLKEDFDFLKEKYESLELDLNQAEKAYVEAEKKNKRKLAAASKEKKIEILKLEEKQRQLVSSLYREAISIERMINWYKKNLSELFEDALMPAVAKDVKNAYNYNSSEAPRNFEISLAATNECVQTAFSRFMDAQKKAMKKIRLKHAELSLKADRAAGLEAAHHIQVLSEKHKEMIKLKNQIAALTQENKRLKDENTSLAFKTCAIAQEMKQMEDELNDRYNMQGMNKIEMGDELSGVKPGTPANLMQEGLALKLKDCKEELHKVKRKNSLLQQCLNQEMYERQQAESLLNHYQKNNIVAEPHVKETVQTKILQPPQVNYKIKAKTQCGRFSKMLGMLKNVDPTVKLSHLTEETVTETERAVGHYKYLVTKCLGEFFMLYIKYKRYQEMLSTIKNSIISCRRRQRGIAIIEDDEDAVNMDVSKMQTLYWHVEAKVQGIVGQENLSKARKKVINSKNCLKFSFRKVAEVLLQTKQRLQEHPEKMSAVPSRPLATAFSQLVTPKNSVEITSVELDKGSESSQENETSSSSESAQTVTVKDELIIKSVGQISHVDTVMRLSQTDVQKEKTTPAHDVVLKEIVISDTLPPDSTSKTESLESDNVDILVRKSSSMLKVASLEKKVQTENKNTFVSKNFGKNTSFQSDHGRKKRQKKIMADIGAPPFSNRKDSISTPIWERRSSFTSIKSEQNEVHDIPFSLQLDIQSDLRKARKIIQNDIRRFSRQTSRVFSNLESTTHVGRELSRSQDGSSRTDHDTAIRPSGSVFRRRSQATSLPDLPETTSTSSEMTFLATLMNKKSPRKPIARTRSFDIYVPKVEVEQLTPRRNSTADIFACQIYE